MRFSPWMRKYLRGIQSKKRKRLLLAGEAASARLINSKNRKARVIFAGSSRTRPFRRLDTSSNSPCRPSRTRTRAERSTSPSALRAGRPACRSARRSRCISAAFLRGSIPRRNIFPSRRIRAPNSIGGSGGTAPPLRDICRTGRKVLFLLFRNSKLSHPLRYFLRPSFSSRSFRGGSRFSSSISLFMVKFSTSASGKS